jgi:hypothetical protein
MKKIALGLAVSAAALAAQADVLDFTGDICSTNNDGSGAMVACSSGGRINQAYGDTAAVDVSFKDSVGGTNSMFYWANNYSGLTDVAYAGSGQTGEITLTALGGNVITLQSLDLGAWPNVDRSSQLTVIDLTNGTTAFSSGPITVLGATPSSFVLNVSSSGGFAIQFGPDGFNVGIDNITFTTAVPEASTYAMLLAGLAVVGSVVRRRRVR